MIRGSVVRAKNLTLRRFVSTANSGTKFTTLTNGVTLATEVNPNATTAAVGLFYGGGSRSEHSYSNGLAALTTNLLASKNAPGVALSAQNSKEFNGVVAVSTNANVAEAAKLIASIASKPESAFDSANFDTIKALSASAAAASEANPKSKVLEHLNATAFQGYSLSLPTLGTQETVSHLIKDDVARFAKSHLVSNNVVIAASGNIDHEQLVNSLEASLNVANGPKPIVSPASFLGSEVRMRDDTMPKAYISIAAHGESLNSPYYQTAKVASQVFGKFDLSAAVAKFTSPKLASIVQDYDIVDSYEHFSTSYSDTGLWGFYAETSAIASIDDFVHFTLKEWNRLSVSVTDAEIARAKAQTKTALLKSLNSSADISSHIASDLLLTGHRTSVASALEKIDAVTKKDVKAWAQQNLWDRDVVISGTGQIEDLLDYMRVRNDMAMMRW
ncbi:mitochondrial processing peptidase beta subunit [Scheffersomyces spartinae]|uniref:Mitochondrial processing peptidase beta subunit n=1 Tax=Scheffersomyces spartinae TaxID=45513 RepID=A0A9P7V9X0_9ASCO|nr:mitochondrial processing peptidase beta subunit [Scheffersomyces spartinae]KAG7194111.1 mitochondrial processing peptidase beta subunit [Scheffersomyces spartinae]